MKIIAMILTYNNQDMVDLALKKIPKELFDSIFVSDDCSVDQTPEIYQEKGIKVFRNKKNRGLWRKCKKCLRKRDFKL